MPFQNLSKLFNVSSESFFKCYFHNSFSIMTKWHIVHQENQTARIEQIGKNCKVRTHLIGNKCGSLHSMKLIEITSARCLTEFLSCRRDIHTASWSCGWRSSFSSGFQYDDMQLWVCSAALWLFTEVKRVSMIFQCLDKSHVL